MIVAMGGQDGHEIPPGRLDQTKGVGWVDLFGFQPPLTKIYARLLLFSTSDTFLFFTFFLISFFIKYFNFKFSGVMLTTKLKDTLIHLIILIQ